MRPPRWYDPILNWFRWDYIKLRWYAFRCPHTETSRMPCWDCGGSHRYCDRCDRIRERCAR